MNAVYGLYPDPDSAQRAVRALEGAGVPQTDVAIASSEPFEEHEFGRRESKTLMPWLAALAAICGGALGYLFVSYTQRAYPLPTGAMPLTPGWTDGIIVYELTMLSAVLATLATLIFSARSKREHRAIYDPLVSEGMVLVGALRPDAGQADSLEETLRHAGASEVKRFRRSP